MRRAGSSRLGASITLWRTSAARLSQPTSASRSLSQNDFDVLSTTASKSVPRSLPAEACAAGSSARATLGAPRAQGAHGTAAETRRSPAISSAQEARENAGAADLGRGSRRDKDVGIVTSLPRNRPYRRGLRGMPGFDAS